jgi:hypothetical protein
LAGDRTKSNLAIRRVGVRYAMKVLVENLETHRFYARNGRWVLEREKAYDFKNTGAAMSFCFDKNLRIAQLLIIFPGNANEISMPVPSRRPDNPWPSLF